MGITAEVKNMESSDHSRPKNALTVYLYILMSVYAVSVTMIGPMMPHIIDEYGLRLSQGGLMLTFQSIGGIAAIIFSAITADIVKKPRLILVSYLSFGLALFAVGYIRSFPMLLGVLLLFGAGTRISDTVLNAYISDIHTEKRGIFLNLLHTFFGVGAFMGPIYARYLLDKGISWNRVFGFLGLACIFVILFMPVFSKRTAYTKEVPKAQTTFNITSLLKNPVMWVIGIINILYVGHQSGVVAWMPMYMETELNVDPDLSGIALSVFWLGIIAGRLLCSLLSKKVSAVKLLLWGNLLGGAFLTAGLVIQNPILLILSLGLAGLFTGSTIPLLVTIACNLFPGNTGAASSVIFLCGSLSILVFPWLIGVLAELVNFQWAILLTGIVLIAIAGIAVLKTPESKAKEG